MTTSGNVQCPGLASRSVFQDYINLVRNLTNGTFELPQACQSEVCSALYGYGNADIDGIGMLVGYVTSNVIGLSLAVSLLAAHHSKTEEPGVWRQLASRGFASFYDCALLLALSIQIAGTIMLARLNFGISASGMGDTTVRMTWAVSNMTLLPLIYGPFLAGVNKQLALNEDVVSEGTAKSATGRSTREVTAVHEENKGSRRKDLRFGLFVICWLFSVYISISKLICESDLFAPSEISSKPSGVIKPKEWARLIGPCYNGVTPLTTTEERLTDAFSIGTSLFIIILVLLEVLRQGMSEKAAAPRLAPRLYAGYSLFRNMAAGLVSLVRKAFPERGMARRAAPYALVIAVPLLAITQFWTILRYSELQQQMANANGDTYGSDAWTFGQVVACTVFLPVVIELCFALFVVYEQGDSMEAEG